MGIYYFAVDYTKRERMHPPKDFCIKSPGIFHPHNPFPNMIILMNHLGYDFKIVNDMYAQEEYEFKDITEEVYKQLKSYWPEYDWDIAEWKE